MVGLAQGGDHFSLHKVPAAIAAGSVHALVVQRAQILTILHEEPPLGEVAAANCTGHTHTQCWGGTRYVTELLVTNFFLQKSLQKCDRFCCYTR